MLKRVVTVVEGIAVAGFVVFVTLLLLKQPESHTAASAGSRRRRRLRQPVRALPRRERRRRYRPEAQGGAVTQDFPTADAELVVVTYGRGGMPAFDNRLSPEQLRAVVDFTRNELQQR